ncbi:MAPEG family protein [Povalibacter sp.]|uniref:MAPEG family protein n=1 Tax=Povalibacter sp. TaxID=1962978 RepID=UPI002F42D310
MHYVAIVTVVALLQFLYFGVLVGKARAQYGIAAPAVSGNEIFERYFRVQMNTLEQLLMFLPSLWIFAHYANPLWAASLGVVFVIGRAIYCRSYARDPKNRSLGFALTALPTLIMMAGILWQAIRTLMAAQ